MKRLANFVKIAQDYQDLNIDEVEMVEAFKILLKPKKVKRGRKSVLSGTKNSK